MNVDSRKTNLLKLEPPARRAALARMSLRQQRALRTHWQLGLFSGAVIANLYVLAVGVLLFRARDLFEPRLRERAPGVVTLFASPYLYLGLLLGTAPYVASVLRL